MLNLVESPHLMLRNLGPNKVTEYSFLESQLRAYYLTEKRNQCNIVQAMDNK